VGGVKTHEGGPDFSGVQGPAFSVSGPAKHTHSIKQHILIFTSLGHKKTFLKSQNSKTKSNSKGPRFHNDMSVVVVCPEPLGFSVVALLRSVGVAIIFVGGVVAVECNEAFGKRLGVKLPPPPPPEVSTKEEALTGVLEAEPTEAITPPPVIGVNPV